RTLNKVGEPIRQQIYEKQFKLSTNSQNAFFPQPSLIIRGYSRPSKYIFVGIAETNKISDICFRY
ncbi:hypothetical protein, partial [Parabacteroides distasonis]